MPSETHLVELMALQQTLPVIDIKQELMSALMKWLQECWKQATAAQPIGT